MAAEGYFYIPGTETCLKFGGLVRMRVFGGSDRGRFTEFVDDAGPGDDEDGSSAVVRHAIRRDISEKSWLGRITFVCLQPCLTKALRCARDKASTENEVAVAIRGGMSAAEAFRTFGVMSHDAAREKSWPVWLAVKMSTSYRSSTSS